MPRSDKDKVKAALTIPKAWQALGLPDSNKLKFDKSSQSLNCPWRDGSDSGSFSIFEKGSAWKDHVTEEGGDVFKFIMMAKGCNFQQALEIAAGIAGVQPEKSKNGRAKKSEKRVKKGAKKAGKIVGIYPYRDEKGTRQYEVVRYEPKAFRMRKNSNDWNMKNVPKRFLYNYPEFLAQPNADLCLMEGEKDADTGMKHDILATTHCGGAKGWRPEYAEALIGRPHVTLCPDQDDAGEQWYRKAATSIHIADPKIRLSRIDVPSPHNDVTDFFEAGGTRQDFLKLTRPCDNEIFEKAMAARLRKTLVEAHGEPIQTRETDDAIIPLGFNQYYLAAHYCHDHQLIFDRATKVFYEYEEETGLWQEESIEYLLKDVGARLTEILKIENAVDLLHKRTSTAVNQVINIIKGEVERRDVFTASSDWIHVANGVLHLDGDEPELRPFSPEYYSRNRSEILYDAEAKCPKFIEFLEQALDEDDIAVFQRYAGQCLAGVNLSQTILLLRGTAGGGKSTLVSIVEMTIGRINATQLRTSLLGERFEISAHVGKTLLCGKDVPGDFLSQRSAHVLKSLVGGDRLQAEFKNVKKHVEVIGNFNVLITSNSKLKLRLEDDAAAWRRRLVVIDFSRPSTSKPIPNFDEALIKDEGPGILRWFVEGYMKLRHDLSQTGKFPLTTAQICRVDDLLKESSSPREFVSRCVVGSDNSEVSVDELTKAYFEFCKQHGWNPVSTRAFQTKLPDLMLEIHGASKRHDVRRGQSTVKGFAKVTIKAGCPAATKSQASEASVTT